MQRVLEVTNATLVFNKTNPLQIVIHAEGKVATTGWKNPALTPWRYIAPPANGIQDFDFCADEPTGIVLEVVSPITAELVAEVDYVNYWGDGKPLKGARIHAQNGSKEATFEEKLLEPRSIPWPWKDETEVLNDPIASLIGFPLRVYHEGDAITKDYQSNRFNIVLESKSDIVKNIWRG